MSDLNIIHVHLILQMIINYLILYMSICMNIQYLLCASYIKCLYNFNNTIFQVKNMALNQ